MKTIYKIPRGIKPSISEKAEWMAFKVTPNALELENANNGDAPKPGMALLNTKTGNVSNFENIEKYEKEYGEIKTIKKADSKDYGFKINDEQTGGK